MHEVSYELLNLFEVAEPDGPRHLVCFLDPIRAGAGGISWHCVVGEFDPTPEGDFDPSTFRLNPDFIAAFVAYMNQHVLGTDELREQARGNPEGFLHLVDPRCGESSDEPDTEDLLGGFAIDSSGEPVPDSFRYNPDHLLFDPDRGPSGILIDRSFYDWLHAEHTPRD